MHSETSKNDSQIEVSDLEAIRLNRLPTTNFHYLRSKEALLRWCSKAEVRLGRSLDDLNVR